MREPFGSRLAEAFDAGQRLCLGIDPHAHLLSEWGVGDTAEGAREFGLRVVEAASDHIAIVKPQIAFFERFGSAGFAALEEVLAAARAAGLLVIGDVKRGEIGSSMHGYASAWLTPGSPLEVDAMTLNPYLGVGALQPAFDAAEEHGKGAFVLAATSNPEAAALQQAVVSESQCVAAHVVDDVRARPSRAQRVSSIGVVIGATLDLADFGLRADDATDLITPVLAPGFGAQGADASDARQIFGSLAPGVIVSESRSILSVGPHDIARVAAARATEVRNIFV